MRAPRLALTFAGCPGSDRPHLSVDGMTPAGPNLSHWPGNRTPREWKADLSTGICLAFARADETARAAFLGDAEYALNDHYDTDGFLSLLTILRPEVAFEREEVCLAAAATGDFQAFHTRRGFAIDRLVLNLAAEHSPLASEFEDLESAPKSLARYRWLIDHAETVLDEPETWRGVYADELAVVETQLDAARRGALELRGFPELGLGVVTSKAPVHRVVLNTLAAAYRVLHVERAADGPRYRYHDRTESWFQVVTFRTPRRRDLRALAERLNELEGDRGEVRWCADPPGEPVPELYFGIPSNQVYGRVTRTLAPSRLAPDDVADAFARFFAEPL